MDLKHRNKEKKSSSRLCATIIAIIIVLLQCALFRHHSRIWVLINDDTNKNEAAQLQQPPILPTSKRVGESLHREQQPEVSKVQSEAPPATIKEQNAQDKQRIPGGGTREPEVVAAPNHDAVGGAKVPSASTVKRPPRASSSVTVGTFPPPDDNPCNVTIVTGLYDLGREAFDGRSFETYQEWFGETLETAQQPMVVYVPNEGLKDFVIQHRAAAGNSLTKIIIQPEYPLQYLIPNVTTILKDPNWIYHMAFPKDLTNTLPSYTLIQHSKFVWLQEVIRDNPFNTTQFLWLDAGISRLWHGDMQTVGVRPNICATEFNIGLGSILLPLGRMVRDWPDDRSIGSQKNFFRGTPWLMRETAGLQVCELALEILLDEMIGRGRIDNEQITLWLIYRRHPEWFHVWRTKDVRPVPIKEILGNGTGIGFWLAQ